ncbi:MAG: YfiR family protein [Steroidobacteraceae bacterium]
MRRPSANAVLSRRDVLMLVARTAGLALIGRCTLGAEVYSEDAVKAAFLYRFAAYVTWPPQAARDVRTFTIAVLGADSIAQELERIVAGRMINGLPARVRRIEAIRALGDAQMLFVGDGSIDMLRRQIDRIAAQPILVVTDTPSGLDSGSTVNFLLIDRRLRFEVSLAAADRAGLKVSAELLSVAARVEGDHRRSDISCAPFAPFGPRCPARLG